MEFLDFHPDQIEEMCKQMTDKDLLAFVLTNKDYYNACIGELNFRRFRRFTEMLRNGLPIGQRGVTTNKLDAEFNIDKSEERVLKMVTPIPRSPDTIKKLITNLGNEIDRYFPTDGLSRIMSIVADHNTSFNTLYIDWRGATVVFRYSQKAVEEVEAIGGFVKPGDERADIYRNIPITTGRGDSAAPGFAYNVSITIWLVGEEPDADPEEWQHRRHLAIKVVYND